jgi:hypothetical protein
MSELLYGSDELIENQKSSNYDRHEKGDSYYLWLQQGHL